MRFAIMQNTWKPLNRSFSSGAFVHSLEGSRFASCSACGKVGLTVPILPVLAMVSSLAESLVASEPSLGLTAVWRSSISPVRYLPMMLACASFNVRCATTHSSPFALSSTLPCIGFCDMIIEIVFSSNEDCIYYIRGSTRNRRLAKELARG